MDKLADKKNISVGQFVLIACLACLISVHTGSAQAQSRAVLDKIIFDPVPLDQDNPRPPRLSPPLSLANNTTSLGNLNQDPERSPLQLRRQIDSYQALLKEMEQELGPYAPDLFDELLSLGNLYQRIHDHHEAIATFEKAEYISRVNNGLYTLDQAITVEQIIESHLASGELMEADRKMEYLAYIYEQTYGPGKPESANAFATLGDWNMAGFHMRIRMAPVEGIPHPGSGPQGANPRIYAFMKLGQAQIAYVKAIRALVLNGAIRHPELPYLEKRLVESFFLQANRQSLMLNSDNYLIRRPVSTGSLVRRDPINNAVPMLRKGNEAYERILYYQRSNPNTKPEDIAQTMIEQGDWLTLFNRKVQGFKVYKEAREFMEQQGVPESTIAEMFNPRIPTTLPTFTRTPHTRSNFDLPDWQQVSYDGYIDVSFSVNRFGKARKLKVLGKSEDVSKEVEKRLLRLVRDSQYRPRMTVGNKREDDTIALRYYYGYAPQTPAPALMAGILSQL
jgi:tetratricopeptide (TPR) repeat protein